MKAMKKIKAFVSVGYTPFVSSQAYLADPRLNLPDTPEFEPVRALHEKAIAYAPLTDDMVLGTGLKRFLDAFEQFLSRYIEVYRTAHHQYNDRLRSNNYRAVIRSVEMQLFERLQNVPLIRRTCHNRRPLRIALDTPGMLCELDPKPMLRTAPVCRCGFIPGSAPELPDPERLLDQVRAQIRMAVEILQSEEIRRKLNIKHRQDDPEASGKLDQLLNLDSNDPDFLVHLDAIADSSLMKLLQTLDSLQPPKAVVHLGDLTALLDGQILSLAQARKKVLEWLENTPTLNDSDWIRFEE